MSKVLGSFSADEAALHIAKRNIKPDELSLVFQEGGLSIYFFILSSCFLGGVSATNTKNIFRSSAVQPGSFSHESWITLLMDHAHPSVVVLSHVSSVEFVTPT